MAEALLMDLSSQRSTSVFSTAKHTLHDWLLSECHWNITYSWQVLQHLKLQTGRSTIRLNVAQAQCTFSAQKQRSLQKI